MSLGHNMLAHFSECYLVSHKLFHPADGGLGVFASEWRPPWLPPSRCIKVGLFEGRMLLTFRGCCGRCHWWLCLSVKHAASSRLSPRVWHDMVSKAEARKHHAAATCHSCGCPFLLQHLVIERHSTCTCLICTHSRRQP